MVERKPATSPSALQVGVRIRVRYHPEWRGTIVGLMGPFGPGGCEIYRVEFPDDPESIYSELRGDQLIVLKDEV